jgi:hypothetical protein
MERVAIPALLLGVLACASGPTERLPPQTDASASDSGGGGLDARADGGWDADSGGGLDADTGTGLDAAANGDAAMLPVDSGSQDAEVLPDAATCGNVGKGCALTSECGSGEECNMDSPPGGICLPSPRPSCGGFANAMCPSSTPRCMIFRTADFGPCLTDYEVGCVCTSSAGSARFSCGV